MFPHSVTVTVRRFGIDTYGDPLPPTDPDHQVPGCAFAPSLGAGQSASHELTDLRETVVTGYTLYAPYGSDIRANDEVLLPDDPGWWRVDGEPGNWANPFTGWRPGLTVILRRSRG